MRNTKIEQYRTYLGYGLDEIGEALSISGESAHALTSGARPPTEVEMRKLARLFKVDVSHLTNETPFLETCRVAPQIAGTENLGEEDRAHLEKFQTYLAQSR